MFHCSRILRGQREQSFPYAHPFGEEFSFHSRMKIDLQIIRFRGVERFPRNVLESVIVPRNRFPVYHKIGPHARVKLDHRCFRCVIPQIGEKRELLRVKQILQVVVMRRI